MDSTSIRVKHKQYMYEEPVVPLSGKGSRLTDLDFSTASDIEERLQALAESFTARGAA